MRYRQITAAERYTLGLLRQRGLPPAAIARILGRPPQHDRARGPAQRDPARRVLAISHETIYRYVWADKAAGGTLHQHLRGAKQRRKRYGRYDSRGRLAGKRMITERPPSVATRQELGHWEADTMLGASQAGPCVLSLVERKTGYLLLGQLRQRLSAAVNQRADPGGMLCGMTLSVALQS